MFGIDDIVAQGLSIINKFVPDKNQAAQAAAEYQLAILSAQSQESIEQVKTDQNEAANPNWFVAGWRPMIGWVCAGALTYQYMFVPLVGYVAVAIGHPIPSPPVLDGSLWQLMMGMLGLGAMRTAEKAVGVQHKH